MGKQRLTIYHYVLECFIICYYVCEKNMTIEEFRKTSWCPGMRVKCRDLVYKVIAVDFLEKLIEINCEYDGDDDSFWVRFENVELCDEG